MRAADEDAESELAELRMRLAEQERINAEQGAVLEQLMEEIREGGGPVPGNWINYDASAKPLSAKVYGPLDPAPAAAGSQHSACTAVESWPVEPRGQPRPDVVSRWLLVDPITRQLSVRIPRQLIVSHRHADLASGNPCSEAGRARRRGGRSAGGMMPDLSEMPEMPEVPPEN